MIVWVLRWIFCTANMKRKIFAVKFFDRKTREEIYGYETKNFKRRVKNNIAKFEGDDFMFELDDEEVKNLSRCKNFTLNMGRGSNIKYKPYVFTEQGVYMLMTVLRGELAIKQSRALVKTFKKMKDYILENRDLISQREVLQLSMETANNRIEINKINSEKNTKCYIYTEMIGYITHLCNV